MFKTLDDNHYYAIGAGPRFLEHDFVPTSTNRSTGALQEGWEHVNGVSMLLHDAYVSNRSSFSRLLPEECIAAYARLLVSAYSDVIVITTDNGTGVESLYYYGSAGYTW